MIHGGELRHFEDFVAIVDATDGPLVLLRVGVVELEVFGYAVEEVFQTFEGAFDIVPSFDLAGVIDEEGGIPVE